MPVTLAITDQELATNALVHLKEASDATTKKTALLNAYDEKYGAGNPSEDGGDVIVKPVIVGEHSTITQHSTGFEPITMDVADVAVAATYYWGYWTMPIAISGFQQKKNSGKAKIIDQVKIISKAVMSAFMRNFNRQMLKGDVAALSNMGTLNGVDYTTGFLEEGAAGSGQTNVVGNLSKTTYASITGWNNQSADVAGQYNSNGYTALDTINIDTQAIAQSAGYGARVGICSKSFIKNTKRALHANERYMKEETIDGGRMRVTWDGMPLEFDPEMPNAGAVTGVAGNNDEVSLYALDLEGIYPIWHNEGYFELSEFMQQSGSDIKAAFVTCMAQLIGELLGSSGVIIGGDTF